jgi:flagellar basal-body rod modification protein FlgD
MAVTAAEINNYMGYTTQKKEPSANIDKEGFMKLLVVQLQNQDPTQQQDPAQMVQQMTGFSTVEQLQNVAALLDGMQEQNVALFQSQSTNLVGKTARIQNAPAEFTHAIDGDLYADIGVDMGTGAAKVLMVVTDENGKRVGTKVMPPLGKGHHDLAWDGTLDELKDHSVYNEETGEIDDVYGTVDKSKKYNIQFLAFDEDGEVVPATTVRDLRVESVAFAEGTVLLFAGGRYYSLGDIIEVRS